MNSEEQAARIADLEAELRRRDERVRESQAERREALELVDQMREQVDDYRAVIDAWIEVFDMRQNEAGTWEFDPSQRELWDAHSKLQDEHAGLIRRWNKFVGDYNATVRPRERGRPLDASEAQAKAVLKLRKADASLRAIAKETGLGLRTVRTIVEKDAGTDRTAKRTNLLRRREIDRLRAARWRARKRGLDELPGRIARTVKQGEELVKAAKGLGRE